MPAQETVRAAIVALRGTWAHRRLGLLVSWLVGVAALAAALLVPAKYEASARIFANTDSILKPLMTGLTVLPNEDVRIVMLSRLLISRPNVERLVRNAGLDAQAQSDAQRDQIIDAVMKTLEIKVAPPGRDQNRDNLYTLSYRDTDPVRAKLAVSELAAMFIESSKGGKAEDTNAAKKFIEEQIVVYDTKLKEAEERLKDFRVRHAGLTPSEGKDFFRRISETATVLSQARLELREAQTARDALRRGLESADAAADPQAVAAANAAAMIAELDGRIDAMRRSLDAMLQKYTDSHPDVLGARRVIRELEEQRRLMVAASPKGPRPTTAPALNGARASESLKVSLAQAEASVASLSSRVAEYTERYNRLQASATQLPQLEAEYAQLNRDYDVHKKNYETLVARRESAAMSGELQSVAGISDFRMVDPPRVTPRPIWPNRGLLIPLALLVALISGVAAAYVASQIRPTFYDGRQLRQETGLPVLGVVSLMLSAPERAAERKGLLRFAGGTGALVGTYMATFVVVELLARRVA